MKKKPKRFLRQPKRSLRTILIVWFLLFSLIPVAFVTGYSLEKYKQAIDGELVQRLRGNIRELIVNLEDQQRYLANRANTIERDTTLTTHLAMNNVQQARAIMKPSVRNSLLTSCSLFDRDGRLLSTITQDENADQKENALLEEQNLALAENYKQALDTKGRIFLVNRGAGTTMDFIVMSRLQTATGRKAGYVEQIFTLGPATFQKLKERFSAEILLLDTEGKIVGGSHGDFQLLDKGMFTSTVEQTEVVFDLPIRQEVYGFMISPVRFGDSTFYVGVGASKQRTKSVLKTVNTAFFAVAGGIFFLAIITAIVISRVLMRPLNDLLHAIQVMEARGDAVEVPVTSETELGVLTDSFNEMSRSIRQARGDLEKKIKELERANVDLKDAQARLVHSSKMVSLGQLVAGVAHELNNPIGFIYSNMTHLRDYSNRLLQIIETVEKNPTSMPTAKDQNDYEYIVKDLPRLIQSCEDGSRRVRDIVVGLRNFSRLEEAKIKRIDLKDGIEQTLQLLTGELKGRINVHTKFAEMPQVLCYASQLNQVFMNILSNAAQAIDGEGEIWITTKQIAPKHGEKGKGRAEIKIRDSGKGMPPEIQDKIFDPFFTTKGLGQGTGLGLSISYGIIKKHSGDITVKSEPGKGTEFTIILPIDGPPGAESQAAV
jgi:two-component system, NtrC family, sensor kinase